MENQTVEPNMPTPAQTSQRGEQMHTPELSLPDMVHDYQQGQTWIVTVFDNAAPSGSKIFACAEAESRELARERARLITAAPAMLEALTLAMATIARLDSDGSSTGGTMDVCEAAINLARRELLAKAEAK